MTILFGIIRREVFYICEFSRLLWNPSFYISIIFKRTFSKGYFYFLGIILGTDYCSLCQYNSVST